jgi:hypothetical protein
MTHEDEGLKDIEIKKQRMIKRHINNMNGWKDSVECFNRVAVLERPLERTIKE